MAASISGYGWRSSGLAWAAGDAGRLSIACEEMGSEAGYAFSDSEKTLRDVTGSEGMPCIPPYLKAASSCGESGRDFRRSFCRRFWNQI